MKTNVVMVRVMGEISVQQRTSDGMFNATALMTAWCTINKSKKVMGHFLENASTKVFIKSLAEQYSKDRNSDVKVIDVKKGRYGGTWMDPLIFIDFAMWLDTEFKITVLQFVYDNLIAFRKDAANKYKDLCAVGKEHIKTYDYRMVAVWMNYVTFGCHVKDLRQNATEQKLVELNQLENDLAVVVEMGYVKTMPAVKKFLQKKINDMNAGLVLPSSIAYDKVKKMSK